MGGESVDHWRRHRPGVDAFDSEDEWLEFEGTSVVRPHMDGRANRVELRVSGPAGQINGLNLRLYAPAGHRRSAT